MFLLEMAENPVTLGDEFETELKIFTRTRKLVTNNPILPEKNIQHQDFLPVTSRHFVFKIGTSCTRI